MVKRVMDELLKDARVIAEINKHKWYQSEKAGHDIGFEAAARDWMKHFGTEWFAGKDSCACPGTGRGRLGRTAGGGKKAKK